MVRETGGKKGREEKEGNENKFLMRGWLKASRRDDAFAERRGEKWKEEMWLEEDLLGEEEEEEEEENGTPKHLSKEGERREGRGYRDFLARSCINPCVNIGIPSAGWHGGRDTFFYYTACVC